MTFGIRKLDENVGRSSKGEVLHAPLGLIGASRGVPEITFFFIMAGMGPAYVQKQLGHSSISITVDIYGHRIPGEGRAGLEAALTGGLEKGAGEGKTVPFSVP
jgi:hypothetical protein